VITASSNSGPCGFVFWMMMVMMVMMVIMMQVDRE
jgi:hypothetical protein